MKDSYIKLILSPCGTSLFINNTEKKVRELISKYANFLDIPETEEKEILRKHVKNRKELFLKLSPTEAAKYSAEVNGLYHIYKKFGGFLNNKIIKKMNIFYLQLILGLEKKVLIL